LTVFDREKASLQHDIEEKEDMIRQRNGEIQVHSHVFYVDCLHQYHITHPLRTAFNEFLGDTILLVKGPEREWFKRVLASFTTMINRVKRIKLHGHGAFRKLSPNWRNLKTPAFVFMWTENNLKMEHFEKDDLTIIM